MSRPQPSAEHKDLTHSFESGVLEKGNMENMQGGVPWGPGLRNTDLSDVDMESEHDVI